MDSAIASSIYLNTLEPFSQWNIYTQDVAKPTFNLNSEEQASYISIVPQEELNQAIDEFYLKSSSLQNTVELNQLKLVTDPFYNFLKKRSEIKYVREYYDLLTLDSQLQFFSEKSVVLTFDPRYLQFLYERNCYIILILLDGQGSSDASVNDEDEKYYDALNGVSSKGDRPDRFERIEFTSVFDLDERWSVLNKLSDEKYLKSIKSNVEAKLPADIIIHVEETYGRTVDKEGQGVYLDPSKPKYNKAFFDPCIHGLTYLKQGGKFILKVSSFSTRLITDICYLYKYLFKQLCISKPVSTDATSTVFYIVAIDFDLSLYTDIKVELDQLLRDVEVVNEDMTSRGEVFNLTSFVVDPDFEGKVVGKQYDFALEEPDEQYRSDIDQSISTRPFITVPIQGKNQPKNQVSILQQPSQFQTISSITGVAPPINYYVPPPQTQLKLQPKREDRKKVSDEEASDPYDVSEIDLKQEEHVIGYKSLNFTDWIYGVNDQIALWCYINIKTLSRTLDELNAGFNDGHPFFIYDQVSYRQSLGFLGRTTLKTLPAFETSDEIVDSLPVETEIQLDDLSKNLGTNFILYMVFTSFVNNVVSFEYTLPAIKSSFGGEIVNSSTRYKLKQQRSYSLREWLGILYSLGSLIQILGYTKEQTIAYLQSRDVINRQYLIDLIAPNPNKFYEDMANEFSKIIPEYTAILSDQKLLEDVKKTITISPLTNLRYRVAFVYKGKKYGLMYREVAGVLGDLELVNLLTSSEKAQLDDLSKLTNLIRSKDFSTRIVEHCCLPVFFSGLPSFTSVSNETAVPQLYLRYKPEVEAFASSINRYAPIWCSANDMDKMLGSSGNFFGDFSNPDNKLFDSIRLMIAFPPTDDILFAAALDRCCNIIKIRKDDKKKKLNLAIIVVYWDTVNNGSLITEKTFSCGIDAHDIQDIKESYNPFTGIENHDAKLKALVMKTDYSDFKF